ncbi:hypothetical protein Tco_0412089 [Tanacetum coccineum]
MDRFRAKLSSWKENLLSIGGRLTFIKAVLGSGLEIGSLKAFSLALLQKWRWHFVHNPDSLWVRVIKAIHDDEASFDLEGCNNSGNLSSIISSFSTLHARDIISSSSLCRKVCDNSNENCLLADHFSNDTWIWNWIRQSIGSRNVAALDAMISEIGHISFNNGPDTWSWKISDDDTFSVQATRSHIENCLLPSLHPVQYGLTFFLER